MVQAMAFVIAAPCIGARGNSCVGVGPVAARFAEDRLRDGRRRFAQIDAASFEPG